MIGITRPRQRVTQRLPGLRIVRIGFDELCEVREELIYWSVAPDEVFVGVQSSRQVSLSQTLACGLQNRVVAVR